MKKTIVALFSVVLISSIAWSAGHRKKHLTGPTDQGQALVDGMLGYKNDGPGTLTIEGPAARIFFTKMSDNRITSSEPTAACQQVVMKSGDNMECGHCVDVKKKSDDSHYWCTMLVNLQYGQVLPNPIFGPASLH